MMSLKRIVLGTLMVFAGLVLIGCPDGSLFDLLGGAGGPTPGDGGAINVDAIDQTTIDISWAAATHDTTPAAEIEYQVYYAASGDIETPDDAVANGDAVFATWETERESATIAGLTRDTEYWVTVLARDADANMSAYTARTASTAIGPVIRLEDLTTRETILEGGLPVDYGNVTDWLNRQFSIWNDGDQTLTISSTIENRVVLTGDVGADYLFGVLTQPASEAILPNNEETFAIIFWNDYTDNDKFATATIASNDPSNAEFIFQLTAFAVS